MIGRSVVAAVAASLATVPGPFGPVAQDPDAVRSTACRLVATSSECSSATATPTQLPSSTSGSGLGIVASLLWVVLAVAVLVGLYVVARALMNRSGGRRERENDDHVAVDGADEDLGEAVTAVAIDRSREPSQWRHEAEEHRRVGRYRDAVRCRYRALVGDLARRGVIDEVPGRTSGEERAQLGRILPAAYPPFDRAAGLFDGAWFGHLEVGERDDDAFIALEHDVLQASAGRRR
jgi:hypothetical protein